MDRTVSLLPDGAGSSSYRSCNDSAQLPTSVHSYFGSSPTYKFILTKDEVVNSILVNYLDLNTGQTSDTSIANDLKLPSLFYLNNLKSGVTLPINNTTDSDGDTIFDTNDNCPNDANTDQSDNDNDGQGNVCDSTPDGDPDTDNDGINDNIDNCPNDSKRRPTLTTTTMVKAMFVTQHLMAIQEVEVTLQHQVQQE